MCLLGKLFKSHPPQSEGWFLSSCNPASTSVSWTQHNPESRSDWAALRLVSAALPYPPARACPCAGGTASCKTGKCEQNRCIFDKQILSMWNAGFLVHWVHGKDFSPFLYNKMVLWILSVLLNSLAQLMEWFQGVRSISVITGLQWLCGFIFFTAISFFFF